MLDVLLCSKVMNVCYLLLSAIARKGGYIVMINSNRIEGGLSIRRSNYYQPYVRLKCELSLW
jgi:hypothetical protein